MEEIEAAIRVELKTLAKLKAESAIESAVKLSIEVCANEFVREDLYG